MTNERHEVSDALITSMLLRRAGRPDGRLLDDIVIGTRGLAQARPWWARLVPARSRGAVLGLAFFALTVAALALAIAASRRDETPRQNGIVVAGVTCGVLALDPATGATTTLAPPPPG